MGNFRKTSAKGELSTNVVLVRRFRMVAAAAPLFFALFLALALAPEVQAEEWPSKPVTVVYPYKAGGGGEQIVRLLMGRLSRELGQQVVVENRAGAGGTIGSAFVAKARPDGYTLVVSGIGSHVIAPEMLQVSFDAMEDFTHIALLGGPPQILAVNPALGAKTLQQYVALSRSMPEGIAFGSPGPGTHGHLSGELFKSLSGARMLHVPYGGGGPALVDLLAGHIPSAVVTLGLASQHLREGKLRALAVSSAKRLPDFPDVPTFTELGYKDLNAVTWSGLSGPAKLPRAIVVKLNTAVRAVLAQPDIRSKLLAEGMEPADLDADGFSKFLRAERARWTPVARLAK